MKNKCECCDKIIKQEWELFQSGNCKICGDCAIKEIIIVHGVSENEAYHILERIQFGNGYGY